MELTRVSNETSMNLFRKVSERGSAMITSCYSTSFSMGILALGKQMRAPIRNIYGFVRIADEIVDTFHEHDKRGLLEDFRRDTYKAIDNKISYNPVLQAFQLTVHEYNIDRELIDAFLDSMEMDLDYRSYENESFEQYIYGSAEVVGLMCLKVFCNGEEELYRRLVGPARSLGAAFQKINFLRDLKSDFKERGRIYFPQVDQFQNFDMRIKKHIEEDIEKDFDDALLGIKQLPPASRFGVYIAYVYFRQLLIKINKMEPKKVMEQRIRVSNPEKLMLLASSWFKYRMNIL